MAEYSINTQKPMYQEDLDRLFTFYGTSDLMTLVFLQSRQIERLQEMLAEYEVRYPTKVRFA